MYTVTIAKVEDGFKFEPTDHLARNVEELYRWVRANFQVTPEEWSKLRRDLDTLGRASIERAAIKFEQVL